MAVEGKPSKASIACGHVMGLTVRANTHSSSQSVTVQCYLTIHYRWHYMYRAVWELNVSVANMQEAGKTAYMQGLRLALPVFVGQVTCSTSSPCRLMCTQPKLYDATTADSVCCSAG